MMLLYLMLLCSFTVSLATDMAERHCVASNGQQVPVDQRVNIAGDGVFHCSKGLLKLLRYSCFVPYSGKYIDNDSRQSVASGDVFLRCSDEGLKIIGCRTAAGAVAIPGTDDWWQSDEKPLFPGEQRQLKKTGAFECIKSANGSLSLARKSCYSYADDRDHEIGETFVEQGVSMTCTNRVSGRGVMKNGCIRPDGAMVKSGSWKIPDKTVSEPGQEAGYVFECRDKFGLTVLATGCFYMHHQLIEGCFYTQNSTRSAATLFRKDSQYTVIKCINPVNNKYTISKQITLKKPSDCEKLQRMTQH